MTKKKTKKASKKVRVFNAEVEDLGCAAALSLAGFAPILMTGGIPWEFSFIFEPEDRARDMIISYRAGTLEVNAKDYFEELETLKSQVDDRRPRTIRS